MEGDQDKEKGYDGADGDSEEEEDQTRARMLRMLENQRRYMEVCNHSAHLLQMLSSTIPGVPDVDLNESMSDETDTSASTSSESEASTPAPNAIDETIQALTAANDNRMLWSDPIITCQLINTRTPFIPDVRHLPTVCRPGASISNSFGGAQRGRWRTGLPLHVAMGLGIGRTATSESPQRWDLVIEEGTPTDSGASGDREDTPEATKTVRSSGRFSEVEKEGQISQCRIEETNLLSPNRTSTSCAQTQTTPPNTLQSIFYTGESPSTLRSSEHKKSESDLENDGSTTNRCGGDTLLNNGFSVCQATRDGITSALQDLNDAARTIFQARQMLSTFNVGNGENNNNHLSHGVGNTCNVNSRTNDENNGPEVASNHVENEASGEEGAICGHINDTEDIGDNGFPKPLLVRSLANDDKPEERTENKNKCSSDPNKKTNAKPPTTSNDDHTTSVSYIHSVNVSNKVNDVRPRTPGNPSEAKTNGKKTWSSHMTNHALLGRTGSNPWTGESSTQRLTTERRLDAIRSFCQTLPLACGNTDGRNGPVTVENTDRNEQRSHAINKEQQKSSTASAKKSTKSEHVDVSSCIQKSMPGFSNKKETSGITLGQLKIALRSAMDKLRNAGQWKEQTTSGGGDNTASLSGSEEENIESDPLHPAHKQMLRNLSLELASVHVVDVNVTNNKYDASITNGKPPLLGKIDNEVILSSNLKDEKARDAKPVVGECNSLPTPNEINTELNYGADVLYSPRSRLLNCLEHNPLFKHSETISQPLEDESNSKSDSRSSCNFGPQSEDEFRELSDDEGGFTVQIKGEKEAELNLDGKVLYSSYSKPLSHLHFNPLLPNSESTSKHFEGQDNSKLDSRSSCNSDFRLNEIREMTEDKGRLTYRLQEDDNLSEASTLTDGNTISELQFKQNYPQLDPAVVKSDIKKQEDTDDTESSQSLLIEKSEAKHVGEVLLPEVSLSSLDGNKVIDEWSVSDTNVVTHTYTDDKSDIVQHRQLDCTKGRAGNDSESHLLSLEMNNSDVKRKSRITCIDIEGTFEVECKPLTPESCNSVQSFSSDTNAIHSVTLVTETDFCNSDSSIAANSSLDRSVHQQKWKALTVTNSSARNDLIEKLSRLQEDSVAVRSKKQTETYVTPFLKLPQEKLNSEKSLIPPPPTPETCELGLSTLIEARMSSRNELKGFNNDTKTLSKTNDITEDISISSVSDVKQCSPTKVINLPVGFGVINDVILEEPNSIGDLVEEEEKSTKQGFISVLRRVFWKCIPSKRRTL